MVTKKEMIVAATDLFTAVVEGWYHYDGASDPDNPSAPIEHYDELARAIVTYVRLEPNAENAVRTLRGLLPNIEKSSAFRAGHLRCEKFSRDPESRRELNSAIREMHNVPLRDSETFSEAIVRWWHEAKSHTLAAKR